jgi:hypothetical protein
MKSLGGESHVLSHFFVHRLSFARPDVLVRSEQQRNWHNLIPELFALEV